MRSLRSTSHTASLNYAPNPHSAPLTVAVIAFELLTLSWIRSRFFGTGFLSSFASVALGGAIIAAVSAALGGAAG